METAYVTSKGQLVVPQDVREEARLFPGERFVAFPVQDGVLFKRIDLPTIDFESLAKDVEAQFKKRHVKKGDVAEAVRWARKGSS